MKRKLITILIVLLVAAGAVALLKKRQNQLAEAPVAKVLPVVVEAFVPTPQQVTLTLPAMGVVSSDRSTVLSTKISGRITRIVKQEGAPVKAGELIATIDNAELQARRRALQAKKDALETDIRVQRQAHQRTLELFEVGGASLEQKQKEEAAIERLVRERDSLLQSIREVEELSSYARIVAPVDGTLSERLAGVGDLALPGKPLFRIAAAKGLFLDIRLPADIGTDAVLIDGRSFTLTPKNQAGPTGLKEYRAQLPLGTTLVEGEYVNVDLVLYSGEGVLLPNDTLLTIGGTTNVLAYENGHVRKIPVTVVQRGSEGVMVQEDLAGMTLLMAKPDILLRATSGVPVRIFSNGNA